MFREIAEGVFWDGDYAGGNVGLIVGQRGALLVDTPMFPPEARQLRQALREMGFETVYGIVNTDFHPEHFFGNDIFMPTRTFGHRESTKPIGKYISRDLRRFAEDYRDEDPALAGEIMELQMHYPEICVEDRVTIHLGGRDVQVLHFPGHTPSSLVAYLPRERLLYTGDNIWNNEHPALIDADSLAWLDTLKRIQEMPVTLLIPGSGEPCGKEVIDPLYEYIAEMRRRTLELFREGNSRRSCVDKVGMFDYFPIPEDREEEIRLRRRRSVEQVYTEIRIALRRRS